MSFICGSYDSATGKICWTFTFYNEEGRRMMVNEVSLLRKDGTLVSERNPGWLSYSVVRQIIVDPVAVPLGTPADDTRYRMDVQICMLKAPTFDTDGEDTVYTFYVEVQDVNCLGEPYYCVFDVLQRPKCDDVSLEANDFTMDWGNDDIDNPDYDDFEVIDDGFLMEFTETS